LQPALRVNPDRCVFRAVEHVLAALQQVVFSVDLLDGAGGVGTDEVFGHHHVTGLRDREIRLGGDHQTEGLEIGCG
jgi:hypothetical protein